MVLTYPAFTHLQSSSLFPYTTLFRSDCPSLADRQSRQAASLSWIAIRRPAALCPDRLCADRPDAFRSTSIVLTLREPRSPPWFPTPPARLRRRGRISGSVNGIDISGFHSFAIFFSLSLHNALPI